MINLLEPVAIDALRVTAPDRRVSKVGRFRSFENLVDVERCAAPDVLNVGVVRHKPPSLTKSRTPYTAGSRWAAAKPTISRGGGPGERRAHRSREGERLV